MLSGEAGSDFYLCSKGDTLGAGRQSHVAAQLSHTTEANSINTVSYAQMS